MPRGDKDKYTDKQKRKAEHIAEGYEERGASEKTAKARAWATVNKESGGGNKSGSGRGKKDTHVSSSRGGRAHKSGSFEQRSAAARKGWETRRRNGNACPEEEGLSLFFEVARQRRLAEDPAHAFPARFGRRAGRFDVGADHLEAETVVDDVAAVGLREVDRLRRALGRGQLVALGERDRLGRVDLAREQVGGDRVAGRAQIDRQLGELEIPRKIGGRQAGQRSEHVAVEREALVPRKRELDAVIGRAFRQQRLRRIERIDGVLDPAAPLDQFLLEQHVVDVVPRVSLVAAEVPRPLNPHR